MTEQELINFLNEYEMPIPPELKAKANATDEVSVAESEPSRILICDDEKPYAHKTMLRRADLTRTAPSGFEAGTELMLFKPHRSH